jgi:hypothetical protein
MITDEQINAVVEKLHEGYPNHTYFAFKAGVREGAKWCRDRMLPEIVSLQKLVIECQGRIKELDALLEIPEGKLTIDEAKSIILGLHED